LLLSDLHEFNTALTVATLLDKCGLQ